ncbi:DUF721 domain-containing protein [Tolypothrix campylonemoides VB511288]|nr:DUF721 domain-containing protein [Tolypothrix campylonemoides VB511288]
MSRSRSPRPPSGPRPALDALATEPSGDAIRRALWLDELDRRLRPCLPPSLAAHARLANVDRGRLVFLADSPVWRAKLRLATPDILVAARSVGLDAREVVIKAAVGPPPRPPSAPPRTNRTLAPRSAATREALAAALASLTPVPPRKGDAS